MPATQRVLPQQRISALRACSSASWLSTTCGSGGTAAPHAQATDPAVREDIEAQVRALRSAQQLRLKEVSRVRAQLGLRQQARPALALDQVGDARARSVDALDRAAIGEVAAKVVGVDLHHLRHAARGKLEQDPVAVGLARATR